MKNVTPFSKYDNGEVQLKYCRYYQVSSYHGWSSSSVICDFNPFCILNYYILYTHYISTIHIYNRERQLSQIFFLLQILPPYTYSAMEIVNLLIISHIQLDIQFIRLPLNTMNFFYLTIVSVIDCISNSSVQKYETRGRFALDMRDQHLLYLP